MKNRKCLIWALGVLFLAGGTAAAYAKDAEDGKPGQVPTQSDMNSLDTQVAMNQKQIENALAKMPPEKVRAFSEEMQRENAAFQQKYLETPIGEREKIAQDFSD